MYKKKLLFFLQTLHFPVGSNNFFVLIVWNTVGKKTEKMKRIAEYEIKLEWIEFSSSLSLCLHFYPFLFL